MEAANKSYQPLLKWAGGKRWLLPRIEALWRPHADRGGRYVEPFSGAAAIALGLAPQRALINDVNFHLINFYRYVRRGLLVDIDFQYDEGLFYLYRDWFNDLISKGSRGKRTSEAAQLFYYLNRTAFNGLCRFNSSGRFNVPFGKYKAVDYRSDFLSYRGLFRRWEFSANDFEKIELERGDFVYCDPPYFKVGFDRYSAGGFSWDDQVRLAEWLARCRGPVLLSNQAAPEIVRLYRKLGFRLKFIYGPRRISANGVRRPAREVLATRNV